MIYRQVCKARGCKAQAIRNGHQGGRKLVCKYCERCATHCQCEGFEPASSLDDILSEREQREANQD